MAEPVTKVREESGGPLRVVAETPVRDRRDQLLKLIAIATSGGLLLGIFYSLYLARTILIPIVLAFLLNLLLSPVVRRLARWGVPEGVGAAVVLILLLGAVGTGIFQLSGPASDWFDRAPYTMAKLELRLRELKQPMEEVREATRKVEELANVQESEGDEDPQRVVVRGPSIAETFLSGTGSVLSTIMITIVLLYFLLASGDMFLRKLVQVLPKLKDKKRAIEIARQSERDISAYLLTITCVNACLGIVVGTAMWAIGLPNPVLWGVLAGISNFIPYLGPIVMAAILALVGLATFATWSEILSAPGIFLALTALEGQLLTPMILGRRLTLNPVVIFLSLLVWGFLWGIPGILLAVPVLATFKILCDHIEPLYPVGQFLGRRDEPGQEPANAA